MVQAINQPSGSSRSRRTSATEAIAARSAPANAMTATRISMVTPMLPDYASQPVAEEGTVGRPSTPYLPISG